MVESDTDGSFQLDHDPLVADWIARYQPYFLAQLQQVAQRGADRCMVLLSLKPGASEPVATESSDSSLMSSGYVTLRMVVNDPVCMDAWEDAARAAALEQSFLDHQFQYVRYDRCMSSSVLTFEW